MEKLRFYLNPNMIEKATILNSIRLALEKYSGSLSGGKCLDMGCGTMPYKKEFEARGIKYTGIDLKRYSKNSSFDMNKPDLYFTDQYLKDYRLNNIKSGSYEIIASFQVIEHHEKPEMFFREARRILKKNGRLLITFPFIWELHEEPYDYQRLTHHKIEKLAQENGFKAELIIKRGGLFSVISQLLNIRFMSLNVPILILRVVYLITLFPFQLLAYLLDGRGLGADERTIFLGYTILLRKTS